MRYYKEAESIDDFEWWSGAKDRIDEIRALPEEAQQEFWDHVEEVLGEQEEGVSETELNDFVWFDCDDFIEELKSTYSAPDTDEEEDEEGE